MNTSGPLFSRLEELLQWQRQQQQKLFLEQKQKQKEKLSLARKQLAQSFSLGGPRKHVEIFNSMEDGVKEETGEEGKSICKLNTIDQSATPEVESAMAFDDTPVKQSSKCFSELLEEKLECERKNTKNMEPAGSKPKRKFLKRGEGLARFRMKPLLPKLKHANPATMKDTFIQNSSSRSLTLIKTANPVGSKNVSRQLEGFPGSPKRNGGNTVGMALEGEKSKREQEELRVFELMEQHAANSSFCSTSSLVARFMDDSVRSPMKYHHCSNYKNQNTSYVPSKSTLLSLDREHSGLSDGQRQKKGRKQVHSETGNKEPFQPSNKEKKDIQSLKVSDDDEAIETSGSGDLKEVSVNNRVVGKTSPYLHDDSLEHPKTVDFLSPVVKCSGEGPVEEDEGKQAAFGDFEVWSECSCSSCGDDLQVQSCPAPPARLSPLPAVEDRRSSMLAHAHKDFVSSPEIQYNDQTILFKSALLRERYQELEKEIMFFKTENAKLDKLRRQHEEEVAQFKQERKLLERMLKEKTENVEQKLQEEQKKLARERQVFEKYCKGNKSQLTKHEREEIQGLKKQILELKEELACKDRRWSASQIRVHDRMRQLNRQIIQLKEENEKLKNDAAKVKKVRFSNSKRSVDSKTKVLHAVNNQLGRLKINDINAPVAIKNVVPRKRIPASVFCQKSSGNASEWRSRPLVQSSGVRNLEKASAELSYTYSTQMSGICGIETDDAVECHEELNDDGDEFQLSENEELVVIDEKNKDSHRNDIDGAVKNLAFDTFYPDLDSNLDSSVERIIEAKDKSLLDDHFSDHSNSILKHKSDESENGRENELLNKQTSETGPRKGTLKENAEMRGVCPQTCEPDFYQSLILCDGNEQKSENSVQLLHPDGTREKRFPDGRQEIWYPNGNLKKVSADKLFSKIIYYNGDVKEMHQGQGMEKYFYAETRTWQTTYADGMEILEFPSGQVECKKPNGDVVIHYPNDCVQVKHTNGSEEWTLKDGSRAKIDTAGYKEILLPNGQKEIHSNEHKRREYPDGTVKCIYPDGTMETRYSDGRIRLKDKDGNLIMDSGVR